MKKKRKLNQFFAAKLSEYSFPNSNKVKLQAKAARNSLRFIYSSKNKLIKSFFYLIKSSIAKTSAKRPIKLQNFSAFNKIWQKFFVKKNFKTYHPFLRLLRRKLAQAAFNVKARGIKSKLTESYLAKIRGSQTAILGCLKMLWPGIRNTFCKTLLTLGFCKVNGSVVYSPLINVFKHDLISLSIPSYMWLALALLSFRSSSDQKKFNNFSGKFSRYCTPGSFEVSYKLSEVIVLEQFNLRGSSNTSYSGLKTNFQELLLQRYFSKQKKFGLGKNL